jgi:hypothetical protein
LLDITVYMIPKQSKLNFNSCESKSLRFSLNEKELLKTLKILIMQNKKHML